jgi:8-oxo-dGTP pyrophosphatase MutT (NUDIX family)
VIEAAILTAILARLAHALARSPLHYRPLVVDGIALGWLDDARATRLAQIAPASFAVDSAAVGFAPRLRDCYARSAAIAEVALTLRAEGALPGWRDERYSVAPAFGAQATFVLERGAARWFGVHTYAAHVNGLAQRDGRPRMWLARRSLVKAVDPELLDNLVGGGISAGMSIADTVVKEAFEEAGIAADLARRTVPAGAIHVQRALADGLQRETLYVHDLDLPADFVPANQDGEAVGHYLVDYTDAARIITQSQGPDEMTVDASLVVLDCLLRKGAVAADSPLRTALVAWCSADPDTRPGRV